MIAGKQISSLCASRLPGTRSPRSGCRLVTSHRSWLKPNQLQAFSSAGTTAHRVCSASDGWVERLGSDALICFKDDAGRDGMVGELDEWSGTAGWTPARIFGKFLPRQNADRVSPVLLRGEPDPLNTVVEEAGIRYALDFAAGYSHGLFLDQRANRAFVRLIKPQRLLNTFAYTCSFSVVAALAGAATVSVDLSKKSLDRGRENFALNEIDANAGHRFLADDVLDVLPRLARRGEKFDLIILDPPTFSRGNQGRRWQVEQHFEDLLIAALELATPGARILLSTNCMKLDPRTLERMARFCLKTERRGGDFHRENALPDFPVGHGASTLWLTAR
jgi:23S rRNA (cytosine1962-C5)-methyltransferase